MRIFDKELYDKKLCEYYKQNYVYKGTDIWYEQPAVNVYVFGRDDYKHLFYD